MGSVHARLQVSLCIDYDLFHTQRDSVLTSLCKKAEPAELEIRHDFCLVTRCASGWTGPCTHQSTIDAVNPFNASWTKKLLFEGFSAILVYSGALALRTERQSARMSKINNDGLDQYSTEPFKQQQFGTAGVEGVNLPAKRFSNCPWDDLRKNLHRSQMRAKLKKTGEEILPKVSTHWVRCTNVTDRSVIRSVIRICDSKDPNVKPGHVRVIFTVLMCAMCVYCRRVGRYLGNTYGPGIGHIWLDNVRCDGTESDIRSCTHGDWETHSCGHYKDVSISCFPIPIVPGKFLH